MTFPGWRGLLLAVPVLLLLAAAWFLRSEPHLRAYLCPSCAGFQQVAPRIYADGQATEAQIAAALQAFDAAEALVLDFYPDRASDPVWLLCLSGRCGRRDGPRPRAIAYLDLFIFVYPEGATTTILAHELAHTELRQRAGSRRRLVSQAVPAWFDEGLAVYLSQDTRYLDLQDGVVTGCKAGDWPEPPAAQRAFNRQAANQAEALYTASAWRVIDWLEAHGGAEAVLALLEDIRAGGAFSD